jgi:HEAT repeat protein
MRLFPLKTKSPLSAAGYRGILLVVLLLGTVGCGLRTLPPIRYLPLLGAEKKITTTAVLARALEDRDVTVRAQAVKLLGILSQSDDNKIKKAAARVLGEAARDRDPGIRLLALENLGKMDPSFSNKFLFSALKDPNPFVREKVLKVLDSREGTPAPPPAPQTAPQAATTP